MNLLINRSAAMGDVFCIEPICRKLRQYGHNIFVKTQHPEVFEFNTDVSLYTNQNVDRTINLDGACEAYPLLNTVDAYAKHLNLSLTGDERVPIYNKKLNRTIDSKTIAICFDVKWGSRQFNLELLRAFIEYLKNTYHYRVIELGKDEKFYLGLGENYYNKLSLVDSVSLILNSQMFIGYPSGLTHVLQYYRVPMFLFIGCTFPKRVFHVENNDFIKWCWKSQDILPCAACHHLRSQPRLHTECFKAIQECSNFTLDEIISTYHSNEYPQIVDIKNTSNEFKKLVDGMIYLDDQVARVACVNNSATITQIVKNEKYTKIRYIKFNIDTIKTVIPELKLAIRIHQNGNEVFKTEVILKNAYNSELIVLNDDIAINIGEFKVIITKYDIANSNIAFHTTANNKLAMIIG